MDKKYDPKVIEKKWQLYWESSKLFKVTEDPGREKYYILEMFPYPSGKIHMGHVRNYTIGDVIARYKKMKGFNVLHPMGWDAFGLPAENAAIENRTHPAKWTYENIDNMRRQLKNIGLSYDWKREFATCQPEYYRWEQWLFLKMYQNNMAYRRESFVNWCSSCQTVLANEQVEAGICWRCGNSVSQKKLWQWFFRITDYAENLLSYCDKLSGWPDKVIAMQKNWIGKSFGTEIRFPIENPPDKDGYITVFTTRQDTVFGATFMCLAPEHPLVIKLSEGTEQKEQVREFIERISMQDRSVKAFERYEKEGVFIGAYCINPLSNKRMPIYTANFALMEYGTGAVMSVPAHDQRDFDFAKKYGLDIIVVIKPYDSDLDSEIMTEAYTGKGIMINSDQFDGMDNIKALEKIALFLEEKNIGRRTVSFRLRDWGISRQRYWGTPIPIIYCNKCGIVPVPEDDLPIMLPENANLLEDGRSPLSRLDNFANTRCPKCGSFDAKRETDTMDTFVESSWYFARYCSPDYKTGMFDKKTVSYWMPVDQYIGGIEHAVLHLLYSRYFARVLKDFGLFGFKEPFTNMLTQGMVCKETFSCPEHSYLFPEEVKMSLGSPALFCRKCGKRVVIGRIEKMSKSKKNVIDPNLLIDKYGADTTRLFCLFAAPPQRDLEWSQQGIEGSYRFLNRIWHIVSNCIDSIKNLSPHYIISPDKLDDELRGLYIKIHQTIKKVTIDIEDRFHFNTAISAVMELVNAMSGIDIKQRDDNRSAVIKYALESILLLLAPIVPHFAEELWEALGHEHSIFLTSWPVYNKAVLSKKDLLIVIQVNGKLRGKFNIDVDADDNILKEMALADERVKKFIKDKSVKKVIVVKKKLVNIVV